MKLSTVVIAIAPVALVFAAKFAFDPIWLQDWSIEACAAIGAVMGAFGAVAVNIAEPRD